MITITHKQGGDDLEKIIGGYTNNFDIMKLAEIPRADIEQRLKNEQSYDNSILKPLSEKYKKWKARHGYPAAIFKGKEQLLIKSVQKEKINKFTARIFINDQRADVMSYLQKSGRRAFGLSEITINSINEFIGKYLKHGN